MNKFVMGALTFAAAGSLGHASTGGDAWAGIDHEINSLASSLTAQGGGVDVGALIRSSYAQVDDDLSDPFDETDEEIGGWVFQDVDVWLEGTVGDFDWRVSFDFDDAALDSDDFVDFEDLDELIADATVSLLLGGTGGSSSLEDAYAAWHIAEGFDLTWGQFKFPTTLTTAVDPENQLFIHRSILGSVFDSWDLGAMASGRFEDQFSWYAAIQNGLDSVSDEYHFSVRGEFHVNGGRSGTPSKEGSIAAPEDLAGTIGLFWTDDQGFETLDSDIQDTSIFGLDFAGTLSQLSFGGEWASIDDDLGDFDPWAVWVGYLITDEIEIGARYQDASDIFDLVDATAITLGANWYHSGHNAKWSFNVTDVDVDVDDEGIDGTVFELGLTVGRTR